MPLCGFTLSLPHRLNRNRKTLRPKPGLQLSRWLNRVNEITFPPYEAVPMTVTNQDPIFRNAGGVSRHFAALLLSFLISTPFVWSQPAILTNTKPNIVLILADDVGAECLGGYGGTSYRTPNRDALAKSGVRFENAYATPLCTPSRVQLMTGRYGFRTRWTNLIGKDTPEFFDGKEKTFGHIFKDAG